MPKYAIYTPDEIREHRRARSRRKAKQERMLNAIPDWVHAERQMPPPPEVLADRDFRMSLDAPLMGDPLPGYSALDRKMKECVS